MVGALGPDLFGNSVNYYNGQATFSTTDIDLRGNNGLTVRVGRSRVAALINYGNSPPGLIADWELDLPYMTGWFVAGFGWQVEGSQPNNRCSGVTNGLPPTIGNWNGAQYTRGHMRYVPESGTQSLLVPGNVPRPTDGQTSRYVTSRFWQIRCLPAIANASAGYPGEGFIALSPDGTKYYFDWMTTRVAPRLSRMRPPPPGQVIAYDRLDRVEVRIYPTRIEDRFGNRVTYAYTGARLDSITASDGRQITLTYGANGRIATASAHGRTWTYAYDATGNRLLSVQLPDFTSWQYSFPAFRIFYSFQAGDAPPCYRPGRWSPANQDSTATVTHPSGAVGTFTFSLVRQGRSQVPNDCNIEPIAYDTAYHGPPIETDNFALTLKRITWPGLNPAEWRMTYASTTGSFDWQPNAPSTTSVTAIRPLPATRSESAISRTKARC